MGGNMNSLIKISIALILSSFILLAQVKEVDKMPTPEKGIYSIAENVKYRNTAKEAGVEGKVLVQAMIDETGKVVETEIVRSVSKECDMAAVEAIKKTKWLPAEKDGEKVPAEVTVPIKFKLDKKLKD